MVGQSALSDQTQAPPGFFGFAKGDFHLCDEVASARGFVRFFKIERG